MKDVANHRRHPMVRTSAYSLHERHFLIGIKMVLLHGKLVVAGSFSIHRNIRYTSCIFQEILLLVKQQYVMSLATM